LIHGWHDLPARHLRVHRVSGPMGSRAPEIRKTSLDQESLPHRREPSRDALNLIWFFVALFGGLFVLAVLLRLFR